jgi:hypothetical protein
MVEDGDEKKESVRMKMKLAVMEEMDAIGGGGREEEGRGIIVILVFG